jgi:hypothetical protein
MPLRRANTDPLDAASRIADALTRAPVDATKLGAAAPALVKMETVRSKSKVFTFNLQRR